MKVLAPLDGSRLSDGIIPHVRRLLHRDVRHNEVHLLRAVDPAAEKLESRAEARAHLAEFERLLEGEGFRVRTRVVLGEPVAAILEHVVEEKVDLVAMATHGRTGLQRWVRGSVAERVMRSSPASVLLVNHRALLLENDDVHYRHVLVPVDAATDVQRALPALAALASCAGAAVLLLELGTGARGAEARAALEAGGVKQVTPVPARGEAAAAVLDAAREHAPDLIALATGPRSPLSPWPIDDVVAEVTRGAPCPVLLLRSR